jgi:hypothetical protein
METPNSKTKEAYKAIVVYVFFGGITNDRENIP